MGTYPQPAKQDAADYPGAKKRNQRRCAAFTQKPDEDLDQNSHEEREDRAQQNSATNHPPSPGRETVHGVLPYPMIGKASVAGNRW